MNESQPNVAEFTVSELSAALKRTVEDTYGYVRVRGEISGYKGPHGSGHVYFALKDQTAKIDGVIWKGVFGRMRIKPEEGMEVIVTGKLTTYPNRSSYQIIVETLEPAGLGALMALLEERKRKLTAEGLFDEARKQLLPFLPEVIGVVTSPTGAVIRDILHRLADRFPRHVIVWPVKVQGDGSAEQVAAAIRGFNALPEGGRIRRPDLLIVARGGGSLEDLWSFNEEIVVRAAAESMIPLISAVGHETDVTLIDFASDKRRADADRGGRDGGAGARRPDRRADEQGAPRARLLAARPGPPPHRIARRGPRACRTPRSCWRSRASGSMPAPSGCRGRCAPTRRSITRNSRASPGGWRRSFCAPTSSAAACGSTPAPIGSARRSRPTARRSSTRISRARDRTTALGERSQRAVARVDRDARRRGSSAPINCSRAFSYQSVLERGFALVRDGDGHPLRSAAPVQPGMTLDIEFTDGCVGATAPGRAQASARRRRPQPSVTAAWKPRKPKSGGGGGQGTGQGSLFG